MGTTHPNTQSLAARLKSPLDPTVLHPAHGDRVWGWGTGPPKGCGRCDLAVPDLRPCPCWCCRRRQHSPRALKAGGCVHLTEKQSRAESTFSIQGCEQGARLGSPETVGAPRALELREVAVNCGGKAQRARPLRLPSPALWSLSSGVASVPHPSRTPLLGPRGLRLSLPPFPAHLLRSKARVGECRSGCRHHRSKGAQTGSGTAKSPPGAPETRTKGSTSALLRLTLGQLQVPGAWRNPGTRKGLGQRLLLHISFSNPRHSRRRNSHCPHQAPARTSCRPLCVGGLRGRSSRWAPARALCHLLRRPSPPETHLGRGRPLPRRWPSSGARAAAYSPGAHGGRSARACPEAGEVPGARGSDGAPPRCLPGARRAALRGSARTEGGGSELHSPAGAVAELAAPGLLSSSGEARSSGAGVGAKGRGGSLVGPRGAAGPEGASEEPGSARGPGHPLARWRAGAGGRGGDGERSRLGDGERKAF